MSEDAEHDYTPPSLAELRERLKAAIGCDPKLNADLTCRFILTDLRPARPDDFGGKYGFRESDIKTEHGFLMATNITGSLDEALKLLARTLPDMLVENLGEMRDSSHLTGHWLAQLGPRGPRRRMSGPITAENLQSVLDGDPPVSARTPALALTMAIVSALQLRETA